MASKAAKCPELARQQKREANARHRARKKAQQAQTEWALAATAAELEQERHRTAELLHEQEALHKMSAYQQEAAQLLDFAALAEKLEGELTLYPGGAAPTAELTAANGGGGALQSAPSTLAALIAADARGAAAAAAMPADGANGSSGMHSLEAGLAAFGASGGQGQGQVAALAPAAAMAAAAGADALDLDAALAELADADLSLLLQQAQGGSGEDWLDALMDDPLPKSQPLQALPPMPPVLLPQQPAQQAWQPVQAAQQAAQQQAWQPVQPPQVQQQAAQAQPMQPSLQSAVESAHTETALRQMMNESTFWEYPLQPPAWVLRLANHAIRLAPTSLLELNSRRFLQHLQDSVQRWEACPGSRRQIEHLIAARMADRHYCMQQLAQHRPTDLLVIWSKFACPAPPAGTISPDGRPPVHSALLSAAQYLEGILSEHQLEQLHGAWLRFQDGSQAAQQRRAASTSGLHHAAAQQCVSWQKQSTQPSGGCTAERAEAFCSMADGVGGLAAETRDLTLRMLDLQGALLRVLSPIQMARLLVASSPYFADLVQIAPWLFARRAAAADGPPLRPSVAASGVGQGGASGGSGAGQGRASGGSGSGVGQGRASSGSGAAAGSDSNSVQDDASYVPLPVGFADVLLEERLQASEGSTVSKLSALHASGDLGAASCRSAGGGHNPAHLLATAASLSASLGMPGR